MASFLYSHLPATVGIIGAGSMGTQIAQLCARKGFSVILTDVSHTTMENSMLAIKDSLYKHAKQGLMPEAGATEALARIHASLGLEPYKEADFVIEAVAEDEGAKKTVFRRLDQITPIQTNLASNTSSISITRLAQVTSKPHRVVGMHFTHPVHEGSVVELAKGMHTSHQTYVAARSLAEALGMQTVLSEDRPGFVQYRVLLPWINEAFYCLYEGNSTALDIDRGIRLSMGLAHGPLQKADIMGLDVCFDILKVLHKTLGERYRPCPLLAQYVDAGWLGVKTGRGVFSYERNVREASGRSITGPGRISIT